MEDYGITLVREGSGDVGKVNPLKAFGVLVMTVYGIVIARDPSDPGMLDRVDLVVHEAGHMLFNWFGEFLQVLGGTLGQLLVPAGFAVYFFIRRELYSSAVAVFWTGQSLFNISVYVKDAQALDLPLVSISGAEDAIHDWNYVLSRVGLLRWDQGVGNVIYGIGLLLIIAAVAAGAYYSLERKKNEEAG